MAYGSSGGWQAARSKQRYIYKLKKKLRKMYQQSRSLKKWASNFPKGGPVSVGLYGATYENADWDQKNRRRILRYYGDGDYMDTIRSYGKKYIPEGSFERAGRWIGSATGIPGLGELGGYAGHRLSKFVGFGDYGTSVNQIVGGANKGQIDINEDSLTGDVYITQTEFIQNIGCSASGAGASPFQIVSFPINPGLSLTFPFLSQIAQNFTLYEFEGLMFKFNPTSGENNATSNSLGKVIMATNYDPNANPFLNSVQMENYDYANAAKPSQTIVHGVETANKQQFGNMQYVRTGATSRDKVFTDIGTFYVATEGVPFAAAGSQILGELWVTYRVKLSRANLYGSLLGSNIAADYFTTTHSAVQLLSSSVAKSTNSIGCQLVPLVADTTRFNITFPQNISLGTYLITVVLTDATTINTTFNSCTGLQNIQTTFAPGNAFGSTGVVNSSAPAAATNTQVVMNVFVLVQAPGLAQASLNIVVASAVKNTTTGRVWIQQVSQPALL